MLFRVNSAEQRRLLEAGEGQLFDAEFNFDLVYRELEKNECPVPSESGFSHVSLEQRQSDIAQVKTTERQFSQREKAKCLERFLAVEISRSAWFGLAEVVRTTKFDDYFNGVDLVLEWFSNDGKPVRLGVDLTTGASPDVLEKKRQKTGKIKTVKYFRSENTADSAVSVPVVVLGFETEWLQSLIKFAQAHRDLDKKSGQKILPKKLFAEHPLRYLLLEQAWVQLFAARRELLKINDPADYRKLEKIEEVLSVLKKISSWS